MTTLIVRIFLYCIHICLFGILIYYLGDIISQNISLLSVVGIAMLFVILYVTIVLHTKNIISFLNQLKNKKP